MPSAAPQASSEAITALILAIGAWLCFPLGFVAVIIGARARKRARENPGTVGGEQMALAAMIIGGALAGLQFVLTLAYLAIGIVYGVLHSP